MIRKTFYSLLALISALLVTSACSSSSDSNVVRTSNCAIRSFSLGQLRRILHTTNSAGTDSTYTLSFSGSLYPMVIDQLGGNITNAEPLPLGTRLDAALATISADGLVVYAPAADTTVWTAYSATDSINFSQPLVFRVYAYEGSGYRDYNLNLTVRQQNPAEFTWQQLTGIPEMAARTAAQLMVMDNGVMAFSAAADGQVFCARTTETDLPQWTEQPCTGLPTDAAVRTTVAFADRFWMSTAAGLLFQSADGLTWTAVEQEDAELHVHLVVASASALHAAICDSRINTPLYMAASTDGQHWTPVGTEGMHFNIPSAAVAYTQANGNQRVLLAADIADDNSAEPLHLWSLLEGSGEPWTHFTDANRSIYQLPRWQHPCLLTYNGWLVAMGDQATGSEHSTLDTILVSYDNGLNWRTNTYLTAPAALQGTTAVICAATVGEYIWIMAADQLWRVRYNGFGL